MSPGPSAVFLLAPIVGATAAALWPSMKTRITRRRLRKSREENR